jgi:integrase
MYREKRRQGKCRPREIIWTIPMFRFSAFTGLRLSELANLRWRDIDLSESALFIGKQKNGTQSYVPLIKKAQTVLRHVGTEREAGNFVFNTPNGHPSERTPKWFALSASKWFKRAREEAEIEREITFHDLRASFATQLAKNGASAHVIKKALRHSSLHVALKYVDVAQKTLKDEVESAFS